MVQRDIFVGQVANQQSGRRLTNRSASAQIIAMRIPVVASLFVLLLPLSVAFAPQKQPSFAKRLSYSNNDHIPSSITSKVLEEVYPSLVDWKVRYGHPNVPLGNPGGRQCQTLRRMHIQGRLTDEEVDLLQDLGFRFHSLEDVYREVNFDDLFQRLLAYEEEAKTQYQVPKKYAPDPELGAWVTGLRRLGPNAVEEEHAERLNAVGFSWKSNRQCGSKFMKQFREYRDRAAQEGGDDGVAALLNEESVQKWILAQQLAKKRGSLSETRFHYMQQLFGENWMDLVF